MSNNRHDKGSVDDFRRALTDLIRQNDQHGSKPPGANPALRPRHPRHRPVDTNPHANENRPTMPGHLAGLPHPAAPPSRHRRVALPPPMPTRPAVSRRDIFERRMASSMAKFDQYTAADSGTKVQAGLFAGGLLVACGAVFALVSYLVTDDRVTAGSSHFQSSTTVQAASGSSSHNVTAADAKALADIASGSWLIQPSDVKKQVRRQGGASVQQQTASLGPPGSNVMTRQELFGSFQLYLEKTGLAAAANNPDQQALFNSFVRWSEERAEAN